MKTWLSIVVVLFVLLTIPVMANDKTISFAVGHDHEKMLSKNYPIYRANWEFLNESLSLLGYSIETDIGPWARAKHRTQTGKSHGLFMAANFEGRDKWARLSNPIGFGTFGAFYNIKNPDGMKVVASIRLGDHDKILSHFVSGDVLEVSTAHQGFKLLFNRRIDRFVMSESYGNYLLNTELKEYASQIAFDRSNTEKRTIHVAFSKDNRASLEALKILNQAIQIGIEYGLYDDAMNRNNVPEHMRLSGKQNPSK